MVRHGVEQGPALTTKQWRLGRRPALDGIRGLAIVLVVASHIGVRGTGGGGVAGVTLFFVLSGFLITALLMDEAAEWGMISLRAFYARRALRLGPALVVVVLLATAESVVSGHPHRAVLQVAAAASYGANWFRVAGVDLGHLDHIWSLAIEEQFYVVWPTVVVIGLLLRRGRSVLAVAAFTGSAIALALRFYLWHGATSVNAVYFSTETRADALFFGCALAVLQYGSRWARPVALFVPACGLLGLATWDGSEGFTFTWGPTAAAVAGVFLISSALEKGYASTVLSFPPLRRIGRISYGMYLWHFPIVEEAHAHVASRSYTAYVVISLGLSYAAAEVSFRLIESPFLRKKLRFERRRLPPGAAAVSAEPEPSFSTT